MAKCNLEPYPTLPAVYYFFYCWHCPFNCVPVAEALSVCLQNGAIILDTRPQGETPFISDSHQCSTSPLSSPGYRHLSGRESDCEVGGSFRSQDGVLFLFFLMWIIDTGN